MSHFEVYECRVNNIEHVKKSLQEMGLGFTENVTITDYFGQTRDVVLAVAVNNQTVPVGFTENVELVADWFKTSLREKEFTNVLSQLHSKYQVLDSLSETGWTVDESQITTNEQGEIEILATQY